MMPSQTSPANSSRKSSKPCANSPRHPTHLSDPSDSVSPMRLLSLKLEQLKSKPKRAPQSSSPPAKRSRPTSFPLNQDLDSTHDPIRSSNTTCRNHASGANIALYQSQIVAENLARSARGPLHIPVSHILKSPTPAQDQEIALTLLLAAIRLGPRK